MTFEQFGRILLKYWVLVVICVLLVGLGAFIGSSRLVKPLYQSTALVEVFVHSGGDPLTNDNIIASQQLAQSEADLATSDAVLRDVASHYPGLSADDLAKEVTAAPRANTQLLAINVLDPSPTRAANLANSIAATLIKQQLQVTQQATPTPTPTLAPTPTPTPTPQAIAQDTPQATVQATPQVTPQATAQTAQPTSFLIVTQPARPALRPASPNKTLYVAAGLLIGLLLGVILAVIFELFDPRVRTKEALTQLLGWPVLGTLQQTTHNEDVIHLAGYNSNVESYGTLHTNIGFATMDRPLHTLVVTSGLPGEGKSVVASNLAICMAKAGKSTLLIDANLRYPTLHEHFSIPAHAKGFSNAIMAFRTMAANVPAQQQDHAATTYTGPSGALIVPGELSLDPFIRTVEVANLYVMPSGPLPPNPPELLASKAMQQFLVALSNCGAEVVIFDAPALLGLSDASILASKADGTLVVVDITRARKETLKEMKALLEQAGARVAGCVINKQSRRSKNTPYKNSPYLYDRAMRTRGTRVSPSEEMTTPAVPAAISKPLESSSLAGPEEQHSKGEHKTNTADSPSATKGVLVDNEQTESMPVVKKRKTGE